MHTSPYKNLGTERPVCGKNRAEFHGAAFTSLKAIVVSGPQAAPAAQCIVAWQLVPARAIGLQYIPTPSFYMRRANSPNFVQAASLF
jgi:hypothetical protein